MSKQHGWKGAVMGIPHSANCPGPLRLGASLTLITGYFLPLEHRVSSQEGYLHFSSTVCSVLLLKSKHRFLPLLPPCVRVYVTKRHVPNALITDVIKTSYRGCSYEFPVCSEQCV